MPLRLPLGSGVKIMCQLSSHELAWAAGFFDGEGTTNLSGHGNRALAISVPQVDMLSLFRLQKLMNGIGTISDPTHCKSPLSRQPISLWRAYNGEAQLALVLMWPFLGEVKKTQALRAFCRLLISSTGRGPRHSAATHCMRGHEYRVVGKYIEPKDGGGECMLCRRMRRTGHLPPIPRSNHYPVWLHVREYLPGGGERRFVPPGLERVVA
jgi:hypothetical protein